MMVPSLQSLHSEPRDTKGVEATVACYGSLAGAVKNSVVKVFSF